MIYCLEADNGQLVGCCAAEIISVPFYELISQNLEKANRDVQVVCSQMLNGFSRQMDSENTSVEFLWQSIATTDQTYEAQVRMLILFRKLGTSDQAEYIKYSLKNHIKVFHDEMAALNYEISEFNDEAEYIDLQQDLLKIQTRKTYAVAKKERVFSMPLYGYVYYNDLIKPSENINTSSITNALTNHPNSVVSLQIIPTNFTEQEAQMIELMKNNMNMYATNMRFQRGPHLDLNLRNIVDYYEKSSMALHESCYYYNFLVYSDEHGVASLGSKMIEQLETEDREWESAFELIDVTNFISNAGENFFVSPWVNTNVVVYQIREQAFWQIENAPTYMLRMRQLLGVKELKSIFKLPIDDGNTIGLESRRTQSNKEKLNSRIMAEGSFKLGRIRNVIKSREAGTSEAGIPLNDFTQHGLIVGMPGTGKTNFSLGLLMQFWRDFQIPFLVIEPTKNEYRSLVDAIPDIQIFTPGKGDVSPYIINPFIPPDNVTVETYAPGLMTAFKAAFNMPSPLPNVFTNAINNAYVKYGWKKRSTSADPDVEKFGMYEFIRVFKQVASNLGYKGESKANIESAGVLRLVSLIEQNSNIYDTVNTIPLQDLLNKPTIIELNAISDKEQKSLIMAFLLMMICTHTKNNNIGDGKLKNVILIDEAHVLLEKGNGSDAGDTRAATISTIEDMIAEVRSLGTSIIIADQSPTKIGRYIVANTNVKMMFKLVEKESRDIMSVTTNMSPAEYEELARLGVGQAMLHFGKINSPLQIATYNVEEVAPIRKVISDSEIHELERYWVDPEHAKLLVPHRECKYNKYCGEQCDLCMKDDADYVATKIFQDFPEKIQEKKEFVRFLVSMNPEIIKILNNRPSMKKTKQMVNCVKIKYFRKALLEVPFSINDEEYGMIVNHAKFLYHLERS